MDTITLSGLQAHCIIGINSEERFTPQPLVVTIAISCDTRTAARSRNIADTIDYSAFAALTNFILETGRFGLLETAAEALAATVLVLTSDRVELQAISVTIEKPLAFGGNGRAVVSISRTQADFLYEVRRTESGTISLLVQNPELTIGMFTINPGSQSSEGSVTMAGDTLWAPYSGLTLNGAPLEPWRPQLIDAAVLPTVLANPTTTQGACLQVRRAAGN